MKNEITERFNCLNRTIDAELDAIVGEMLDTYGTYGEAIDSLELLDDPYRLTSSIHALLYDQMKKQATRQ